MEITDVPAKKRILIIDDTPVMIQMLADPLETDYEILVSKSGGEGLAVAATAPQPDLILLDIVMPGMDGYEVCRRLKSNPLTTDIPIIFLSSRKKEEDENKGFALGAVDYITKPFNPAIVRARVKAHILLKQHHDELETSVRERTAELIEINRRLEQEIIEHNRSDGINQALFSISNAVNTSVDLHALYRSIHRSLGRVIDAANFQIALYNPETNTIDYPYCVDEAYGQVEINRAIGASTFLSMQVIKSGRSMIYNQKDIRKLLQEKGGELSHRLPEIWVGVPLKKTENAMGMIAVQSYSDPHHFDTPDLNVLHAVSGQIGLAIEQKRAADALRKSEERYKRLSEVTIEGILFHDNGVVVDCNDSFARMFGYNRSELLGKNAIEICICHEYRATIYKNIMNSLSEPFEIKGQKQAGSVFPLEMESRETHYFGKTLMVTSVRDISERKRTEEKIIRMQKMEAIGTLAGGIAHDFNNLLGGILGNIGLLQMSLPEDHQALSRARTIEKIVQRGANLAKQLLGYAREGKYQIQIISINLLIRETLEMFSRTRRQILIHTSLQKDLWNVEGDPTQIEQVLLNLYINAADAMPSGGELFIDTENIMLSKIHAKHHLGEAGQYVVISVRDTGHGMDKETKKRIFDPFFTTKAVGKGTGLGLASAYGIVKNHNGNIDVYSEPGKGSIFKIYLPSCDKQAEEAVALEEKSVLRGNETILLVDDEYEFRDVGEAMLRELGYTVITAVNGREACEIFSDGKDAIDLVILDMIMPLMNGGETFNRLKSTKPAIKVLLSSGYSADSEAADILARGCDGFIQKPFRLIELSKRVRELLDKKQGESSKLKAESPKGKAEGGKGKRGQRY